MSDGKKNAVSYEVLANALFENYESIYDIDLETTVSRPAKRRKEASMSSRSL